MAGISGTPRSTRSSGSGQGLTKTIPADAPEFELDGAFWSSTRIMSTAGPRKTSVHLSLDPETCAFFRAGGKGHLTRMVKVLKAYAQCHREPSESAKR